MTSFVILVFFLGYLELTLCNPRSGLSGFSGLNICLKTRNETHQMNVSYNVMETVQRSKLCLTSFTLRCSFAEDVMRTKYKLENVTRLRSYRSCCEGYVQESESGPCLPSCPDNPCLKGTCSEPGICSCEPGFSGADCSDIGCPDSHTWGQDCSIPCNCEKDTSSSCNSKDGSCTCFPGYGGSLCDVLCPPNTFGQNCSKTCACGPGSYCHHVTGNCVPCDPGYFGDHCGQPCACMSDGTLLCHPGNGFCVCKPGYYGLICEDHCPFGMKDGICYTESIPGEVCACPEEMTCDPNKGCMCKVEGACEGYALPVVASNAHSKSNLRHQGTTNEAAAAVSSTSIALSVILVLICIIVLLGALYYRRRFKRAQKDLHNRVAFYIKPENTVSNEYECVMTTRNNIPNTINNPINNHLRRNADAKNNNNHNAVMNVLTEASEQEAAGPSNYQNNIYEEVTSPTKTKNNELLSAYYKKNAKQTTVNAALRDPLKWKVNNLGVEEDEEDSDNEGCSPKGKGLKK